MNESNILVRLLIAVVLVVVALIVWSVIVPLFTFVPANWLHAIDVIVRLIIFGSAIIYVFTGRSWIE